MMAPVTIFAAAVVVKCLLLFCPISAQPDNTDEVKQELVGRESECFDFYKNRDFTGMCNEMYTEDCVVYLPNQTIAIGREGCARAWEALKENDYQMVGFHNLIIQEVIVTSGGYVLEHSVVMNSKDQYVKYMTVWKRIGGKLYIFYDMFSVNTPYKEPTLLKEITNRRNEMAYYFNTGDFVSACRRFTPDCWLGPSGMPPVTGRDGCKRLMVKAAVSGVARLIQIPEQNEVFDIGNGLVLNHGAWINYDEAGDELDHGKDMTIWKRLEDGQLYAHFDMTNSDIHF